MDTIILILIFIPILLKGLGSIPGLSFVKNMVFKRGDEDRDSARAKVIGCVLSISLIIIVPIGIPTAVAQGNVKQEPSSCETNITVLSAAHQATGRDALLIAIARLGDSERNRELSGRRLHNVRTYISEYVKARSPETIVLAEGERVHGLGRVELYVGGKLFHTLLVPRDGDLLVGSCYYEIDSKLEKDRQKNLYPWRHKNHKTGKRQ